MKRFFAVAIALIMILAISGCGKKRRTPIQLTLSTEDSEAILNAAGIRLPDVEEAKGANSVVKYFGWKDPYQNYDDDEIVNTGYWTFEHKYGGSIEYIETEYFDRHDDLARLILAGTPPDLMPGGSGSCAMFPMNAVKGMIQSVDSYIDYGNPLWSSVKEIADFFVLGGKHYQIVIYTTPGSVCLYNRRVINEWGFDDPAELYYNDEWTWDVFYEMCLDFSDLDEDRFALDGYGYTGATVDSTGQQILQMDEDGNFYSNLDSPELERAWNVIYDLCKNDCNYRDASGNRWARRDQDGGPCGLNSGNLLFYITNYTSFTLPVDDVESNFGAISEGELMFAPLPRDQNGDGNYYMLSDFDDVKGALCIINNADNPDGAALLASCIRFKTIDPIIQAIDSRQLQEVYLWSDEMLDMRDECQRIADEHFLFSYCGNLNETLESAINSVCWGIPRSNSPLSWAQLKENNRDAIEYGVEELNALISEYNQGN